MKLSNYKKVICVEDLLEDSSICDGIQCDACQMCNTDHTGKPHCRVIDWVTKQKGMYIAVEVDDDKSGKDT